MPPGGFTILEVLVAALLIATAMGSIMALNAQAIHTLRATHQAAASSQVLQQRVEMMRARPWAEIASAPALVLLMSNPTESEKELSDARMVEYIKVSVAQASAAGPVESSQTFTVTRQNGRATTSSTRDFTGEHTLLLESALTWRDVHGPHRRILRTIICRAGLTRAGIFGSGLGRAGGALGF